MAGQHWDEELAGQYWTEENWQFMGNLIDQPSVQQQVGHHSVHGLTEKHSVHG